jgi:hypothetical protein
MSRNPPTQRRKHHPELLDREELAEEMATLLTAYLERSSAREEEECR